MANGTALFDVAIVGYGPAAITAAIYSARKRLRVLMIGQLPGGEVVNSGAIENWPGGGETDGVTLAEQMVSHLKLHQDVVTIVEDTVTMITKGSDALFTLATQDGKEFSGKTVIYAAGRHPRLLNVPGEAEYKNKGVSYCATCDAPLFPDRTVVVVGGGNTGAEAVIMLQKIARKIYLLHINQELAADKILVENFNADPKVEIVYNAQTTKIEGEQMVTSLTYKDTQTGKETTLAVEGIFVAIGAIPNTEPVKDLVSLNEFGAIKTDRYGLTDVEGFFAAGDVTDIRDAQIVVAAGHGCSAALSAGDYLSRQQ